MLLLGRQEGAMQLLELLWPLLAGSHQEIAKEAAEGAATGGLMPVSWLTKSESLALALPGGQAGGLRGRGGEKIGSPL